MDNLDHEPHSHPEINESQQDLGLASMSAAEIAHLYYVIYDEFEQAETDWPKGIPPAGSREAQRNMAFEQEIKSLAETHLGKAVGAVGLLSLSALASARAFAAGVNSTIARVDFDAALPLWVRLAGDDDPDVVDVILEDFAGFMEEPCAAQVSLAQAKPLIDALDDVLKKRRRR